MNFESWMVNIFIALVGIVGTYSVLRSRVNRLEEDAKNHLKEDKLYHKDTDRKMDAQFRRIDEALNRCTILEQDANNHLDIKYADEKFVSKYELELKLKNIEDEAKHTSKTVDKIEGKLEELVSILSKGD